nr:reverse transcriptase domain-containing protein [Tanacetum cinerariifolium]
MPPRMRTQSAGQPVAELLGGERVNRLVEENVRNVLMNGNQVGAGHVAYTDRFHELSRLVPHLVTPESKKIERYMYGLASQIRRMVAATEPKTAEGCANFWCTDR